MKSLISLWNQICFLWEQRYKIELFVIHHSLGSDSKFNVEN